MSETCPDTERTLSMTAEQTRFTWSEGKQPHRRYTSLMGMLFKVEGLMESFHCQPGNKAVGVDGVGKGSYGAIYDEGPVRRG